MIRESKSDGALAFWSGTLAREDKHPLQTISERRPQRTKLSLGALNLAIQPDRPLQVPPLPVMTPLRPPGTHFLRHLIPATPLGEHLLRAHVPKPGEPGETEIVYYFLGHAAGHEPSAHSGVLGIRDTNRELPQIKVAKQILMGQDYRAMLFDQNHRLREHVQLPPELLPWANDVNAGADINYDMAAHFEILTDKHLLILMPQMGTNIRQLLRNVWSENQTSDENLLNMPLRLGLAYKMMQGTLAVLTSLHAQDRALRDIRLENMVLREDGEIYPIDFYENTRAHIPAARHADTSLSDRAYYVVPEAITGAAYDGRKADIWTLGTALLAVIVGYYPLQPHDDSWCALWQAHLDSAKNKQMPKVAAKDRALSEQLTKLHAQLEAFAPQFYPLLLRMLSTRPDERPTAAELAQSLAAMPDNVRPDDRPFLRELRRQVKQRLMPVARTIADDTRLMSTHPGERESLRPTLRRANSVDTLLRPFVSPFDERPREMVHAIDEQQRWHNSPQFYAAQEFLSEQATLLWGQMLERPKLLDRIARAFDASDV